MPRWGSRQPDSPSLTIPSLARKPRSYPSCIGEERMRAQPGRPIVPLQNGRRRLERPRPKDGCGGPRSQRRPYHRNWTSRLDDPKRQRMAEKSSLRDEAKMHPPQASGKRLEFDLTEVSFVVNIEYLNRGGARRPAEPVSLVANSPSGKPSKIPCFSPLKSLPAPRKETINSLQPSQGIQVNSCARTAHYREQSSPKPPKTKKIPCIFPASREGNWAALEEAI